LREITKELSGWLVSQPKFKENTSLIDKPVQYDSVLLHKVREELLKNKINTWHKYSGKPVLISE
jgi:hypothetical protein